MRKQKTKQNNKKIRNTHTDYESILHEAGKQLLRCSYLSLEITDVIYHINTTKDTIIFISIVAERMCIKYNIYF